MMVSGSWDTDEGGGMARCRLKLTEKGRSDFEKTHLQNFTNLADDAVEKATSEEGSVASVGERLWLRFLEDRGLIKD
jgi:hypothetical protein